MFEPKNISAADQQTWAAANIQPDQTSDSSVNYEGATSLTLSEGVAHLRNFEQNNEKRYFAKFSVNLNGANLKESGKQLFRDVYFVPTAEELKSATSYTVRKGRSDVQEVKGLPISPKNLLRRFPTLRHAVDGNVPYVANAQTVALKVLPVACVVAYTVDGKSFYKVVENYVVEK